MFIFVKFQCFNVSKCSVKSKDTFSAVPEVRMTDHDRARINLHTLAQLLGMSFLQNLHHSFVVTTHHWMSCKMTAPLLICLT